MEKGKGQTLVDEIKNQNLFVKDKNSLWTRRTARFLNPCTQDVNQAVRVPKTSPLSEIFAQRHRKWPPNIDIRGWKSPQKNWDEWVDRLAGNHAALWNQTGICDAIMSSLYDVPFNWDIVLGLVEFWCPESNTFVFPWGEATITLEDVMILGGFSVIGEPISVEKSEMVEEMHREFAVVMRPSDKKASFTGWFKHFSEGKSGEMEHMGFLSLWLSRYVFPDNTIATHVFPIASQLSQGRRVALAQAVLAGIYHRLTSLKEHVTYCGSAVLFEPFRLVQLWAFEHFHDLRPEFLNELMPGEPRVARWHKMNPRFDANGVRSGLKRVERFYWRPYAADLKNWRHLSYYKDTAQVFVDSLTMDDEIKSFLECLQAAELKGMSCKAKYLPQRVAMQFGMDQDLPAGDCSVYGVSGEALRVYIPPRTFLAGVSDRYLSWWKCMMVGSEVQVVDKMRHNAGNTRELKISLQDQANSRATNLEELCDSRAPRKDFRIVSELSIEPSSMDQSPSIIPSDSSKTKICRQNDDSVIPSDCSETNICWISDDSVIPKQSVRNTFPNDSKPGSDVKVTRPTESSTLNQVGITRQETRIKESNEGKAIVVSLAQNGKRKRVGESMDDPMESMDVVKAGESFNNPLYIDDYAEMTIDKCLKEGSRVNEEVKITQKQVQPSLAEVADLKKALAEREEEVKKLKKAINNLKTANSKLAKKVNGLPMEEKPADCHQALKVYKASQDFSGAVTKMMVPGYSLGAKDERLAIYTAILKHFPGFDFMACGLDPPEQVKTKPFV